MTHPIFSLQSSDQQSCLRKAISDLRFSASKHKSTNLSACDILDLSDDCLASLFIDNCSGLPMNHTNNKEEIYSYNKWVFETTTDDIEYPWSFEEFCKKFYS